jgi:hypothetical protein
MKGFITKVLNFYNTNAKFHSFVMAVEYAVVGFVVSYGSVPSNKAGWAALGAGLVGAGWGAIKRWLLTNVATSNLQMKA